MEYRPSQTSLAHPIQSNPIKAPLSCAACLAFFSPANPLPNAVGEVRALGLEKRALRAHAQRGLG